MYHDIDDSILDMMLDDPGIEDLYGSQLDKDEIRSMLSETKTEGITSKAHRMSGSVPEGARVLVEVESGGMVAWLCLVKPSEEEPDITREEIDLALEEKQVTQGINEALIARLLANPIYDACLIVAKGVKARDGIDGEVKYYFDTKREMQLARMDNDRVDFKELNRIQSVEKEDLLCEVIPPQKGEDGYTVTGQVLKAKDGVQKKLPVGMNTTASEDHLMLYAACDGEVHLRNGQVSVERVLKVENVDTSTGNLRFIGSIEVKGRICSGFTVKATEDIRVGELIESANVSAGGNLFAGQGIKGDTANLIQAGGDVTTPFVENTHLVVGGNLEANVLLNVELECKGKVELKGSKGCLMGGHCLARQVEAIQIGNLANIFTDVEIDGVEPMMEELDQLTSDLMVQEGTVARLQRQMHDIEPHDKLVIQKELLAAIYQKNSMSSRKKQLEEEIERLKDQYSFDIRVREIFPNVNIKIGEAIHRNMSWNKGILFFCVDDCVVTREYSG